MSVARATRLGRYELVRTLGAGGMGVVYEALDRERGDRVALKTLQHADASGLYQFKREFRALSDLSHPRLVPLYELVVDGASSYLTMELVDGAVDVMRYLHGDASARDEPTRELPTMAAGRAREGADGAGARGVRADEARLRAVLAQLVDGLGALHRAGKLHRDVKPSNILVRPDGRVTIVDFGLVGDLRERVIQLGSSITDSGEMAVRVSPSYQSTDRAISGTAHYMSPEQAAAEPLTPASDWYAVGVLLFQALTGELPFDGETLHVLFLKQTIDAPRPSERAAGVPPELDALCARLLARDPALRPSPAEIAAALSGARATAAPEPIDELPFVGREAQLEALERALAASRDGAVLCRVRGASGCGKSALVERFLARHPEARALVARCYEQETVALATLDGVLDALARTLARLDEQERELALPEGMDALARMFPVLARIAEPAAAVGDPTTLRARAARALGACLGRLATSRPLVVHVDDVQWGDEGGLALLADVLVERPRVLFVLGSRLEHEGRGPLAALEALERTLPAAVTRLRVEVRPLGEEASLALARSLLGPACAEERVAWVVREAQGNPLFRAELARHAVGSELAEVGLDALLRARVEALGPAPRALLDACALAARPLPLRLVARVAGLDAVPQEVARTLRQARLSRGTGTDLDAEIETFHDRVREVAVAALSAERRTSLHAALARALEPMMGIEPEAIASHHEAAGDRAAARAWYLRAAEAAASAVALDRAEAFVRRAIGLSEGLEERTEARERLVHLLTNAGRFADAYAEGARRSPSSKWTCPPRSRRPRCSRASRACWCCCAGATRARSLGCPGRGRRARGSRCGSWPR